MDDPVGWSGFTCVSTTSSFESANEIYCGSGNNPEKDKCSKIPSSDKKPGFYTNYTGRRWDRTLTEDWGWYWYHCWFQPKWTDPACSEWRILSYTDYSDQGAIVNFGNNLKSFNNVWANHCQPQCGGNI
jgi:hypothetical protein